MRKNKKILKEFERFLKRHGLFVKCVCKKWASSGSDVGYRAWLVTKEHLGAADFVNNVEIKQGPFLVSQGSILHSSAEEAIWEIACRISGRTLVIQAMSPGRKEIAVPSFGLEDVLIFPPPEQS